MCSGKPLRRRERLLDVETGETGAMALEVVADRALVAQTRLGEDDRVEVEWVGRCWAWLTEGEAPSLMDVAVRDGEIVKLLEPGQVRRVRAMERTIETLWVRSTGWRLGWSSGGSGRSLNRTLERRPGDSGREERSA